MNVLVTALAIHQRVTLSYPRPARRRAIYIAGSGNQTTDQECVREWTTEEAAEKGVGDSGEA
jgi:hypothetical protein